MSDAGANARAVAPRRAGGRGAQEASANARAVAPRRSRRVVALVAARDEADRIAACVGALLPIVSSVVVVDDGSRDATTHEARMAGATVVRSGRRRGKGGAIEGALGMVVPADVWLLADGDLGETAGALAPLVEAVAEGSADLAVAVLPPATAGGFGIVKRASATAIRALAGFDAREPLSGQRALSATAMRAVRPLAAGFGAETAMTIDAVRAGLRVVEVQIDGLEHRPTFRNARGFWHRGRQGWDILRAVAPRAIRRR